MKKINSVKMVRDIRDKQYEETKYMTKDELIQYYKERSEWALARANKSEMTTAK